MDLFRRRSFLTLRLTLLNLSSHVAHSGYPELGISANDKLIDLLSKLKALVCVTSPQVPVWSALNAIILFMIPSAPSLYDSQRSFSSSPPHPPPPPGSPRRQLLWK